MVTFYFIITEVTPKYMNYSDSNISLYLLFHRMYICLNDVLDDVYIIINNYNNLV